MDIHDKFIGKTCVYARQGQRHKIKIGELNIEKIDANPEAEHC